ncbi:hypothetical protein ACEWY4_008446 [Coilia grayii]|uniref:HTH cro/C1-type domain-containing protein n=1 Tax=Coilia grayii TaxID=363190 RepID=A0ABD1KAY9_9TELE
MLSVSNQKPVGLALPLFLVAVATVWAGEVWGAWLPREPKAAPTAERLAPPSTQMLRALQYIQALSQQALPLGTGNRQPIPRDEQKEGAWPREEQQWLQAVLETLQETQKEVGVSDRPKTHPPALNPAFHSSRHRKYPQEEEEQGGWGNSLKRTNENADEQYTPQKLATLQSVFEELQKVYSSKSENKRQILSDYDEEGEEEEGEEEEEEEEADADRLTKMSVGEWEPLGEDDTEDEDAAEEEADYNDLPIIKRSSQSDSHVTEGAGQPDELSSLVDYYVLKLLEKTEQEEKRAADEEEEEEEKEEEERAVAEEERGAASLSLLQLVELSDTLGISPDQLLGLLQTTSNPLPQQAPPRTPYQLSQPARTPAHLQAPPRTTYQLSQPARTPARLQAPPQTPYQLSQPARTPGRLQAPQRTPYTLNIRTVPPPAARSHTQGHTPGHTADSLLSSPHARPLEVPEDAPSTAEILRLLGLPALHSVPTSDITAFPPRSHQHPNTALVPRDTLQAPQNTLQGPQTKLQAPQTELALSGRRADDPLGAGLQEDALERLLLGAEPEERGLPAQGVGAEDELGALTRALQGYLGQVDRGVDMETRQSEPDQTEEDEGDQDLQRILGFFKPEHQDSVETAELS